MSLFKVNVVARNTKDESLIAPPVEVRVAMIAKFSWRFGDRAMCFGPVS
jgi:hypothetical protein